MLLLLLVTTNASHMSHVLRSMSVTITIIIITVIFITFIISQIGIKVMNGTLYHSPHPIISIVLMHTIVVIVVIVVMTVIDMFVMMIVMWWLMLQVLVEHSPHGMLHLIQVTLAQQQQLLFVVVVSTTAIGHVLLYPLDQQVPCHRFHLLLQTPALPPIDHSGHIHDDLPGR